MVRHYAGSGVRFPATVSSLQRGRAVRHFRKDIRGWTQARLAHAAHVGVNTIGRIETRGARDVAVYVKIQRALGINEKEIEDWIRAQPVDRRLAPLVAWFEGLPARDQDLVGQALIMLFTRLTKPNG